MIRKTLSSRWTPPLAGLLIGLVAILVLAPAVLPHRYAGTVLQSPSPVYDFTLVGPDNHLVRMSDARGKIVLLFFGYTSCPDVCPTTLTELREVLNRLGPRAEQVRVLFISVDPEKDTAQRVNAYVHNFDSRFTGLTGSLEDITLTASHYGIFFARRAYNDSGGYLVDHTATLLLVDPQGYLRVVYPYGTSARGIASDVRYLLSH